MDDVRTGPVLESQARPLFKMSVHVAGLLNTNKRQVDNISGMGANRGISRRNG